MVRLVANRSTHISQLVVFGRSRVSAGISVVRLRMGDDVVHRLGKVNVDRAITGRLAANHRLIDIRIPRSIREVIPTLAMGKFLPTWRDSRRKFSLTV